MSGKTVEGIAVKGPRIGTLSPDSSYDLHGSELTPAGAKYGGLVAVGVPSEKVVEAASTGVAIRYDEIHAVEATAQ